MKYLLMILSAFLLVGCDKGETRKFNSTDSEFQLYVDQFKNDHLRLKGKRIDFDIPINFNDITWQHSGQCLEYPDGTREIFINKNSWNSSNFGYGDKKALIYHELGHCALDYDFHKDDRFKTIWGHRKASIMNPSAKSTIWHDDHEINEVYLIEFFFNDLSVWTEYLAQ